MNKKISIGIEVLGIAILIIGIYFALVMIFPYIMAVHKNISFSTYLADLMTNDFLCLFLSKEIVYFIAHAFFIFVLFAGIGILKFKEWGRRTIITLSAIEIIWYLSDCVFANKLFAIDGAVEMLILLGLLLFFTRSKVKEQFK